MFRSLAKPEVFYDLCCLGVAPVGQEKIRFPYLTTMAMASLIVLLHDLWTFHKRRGANHGDPRLQVSLRCSVLQVIHQAQVHLCSQLCLVIPNIVQPTAFSFYISISCMELNSSPIASGSRRILAL